MRNPADLQTLRLFKREARTETRHAGGNERKRRSSPTPRSVLSVPVIALLLASVLVMSIRPTLPSATAKSLGAASAQSSRNRPNIVMLMTDDQTLDSLRFMPNVHALIADKGVTFTNAFVSYPMCCPSRATYFTGQYAHNHRVLYNHPPDGGYTALRDKTTTFPSALQRAGYHTIHIGKYLNGFRPPMRSPAGWTDFRGAFDHSTYNYYGFQLDENGHVRNYPVSPRNYRTDVYTRMAMSIIHREARSGHPFFLNVAFLAPHSSGPQEEQAGPQPRKFGRGMMDYRLAVPSSRYNGTFKDLALPIPPSFNEADISDKPSFMRHNSFFSPLKAVDIKEIMARYHAQLESLLSVDDAVAQIVKTLKDTGQLDHTVVIFTSDNGYFFGEHRIRDGKYFVYDPSVRVPLLMRGPGLPQGVTRTTNVANIDLAPTILALAHATPLRVMDGISLVPLMKDASTRINRDLIFESGPNSDYPAVYHAIRTPRYVYVEYNTGDRELYDMQTDPNQMHSLQDDPRFHGLMTQLHHQLGILSRCSGESCRVIPAQ